MKKGLTEMVFILDRSGSMAGLEAETIGGFNGLIEKQKRLEGEAVVSTLLFDTEFEVLHDRVPLADVKPITDKEYYVRGMTALLDAIGRSVAKIGTVQKYAREEDRAEKVVFVIITDGAENASRQYTHADVKAMIRRQTDRFGWEFLFLGANIDAAAAAESVGIRANHAARYHADRQGTDLNFKVVGEAMCTLRSAQPLDDAWKDEIDKDFEARKKA